MKGHLFCLDVGEIETPCFGPFLDGRILFYLELAPHAFCHDEFKEGKIPLGFFIDCIDQAAFQYFFEFCGSEKYARMIGRYYRQVYVVKLSDRLKKLFCCHRKKGFPLHSKFKELPNGTKDHSSCSWNASDYARGL